MKREGKLWYCLFIILGVVATIFFVAIFSVLDFYLDPEMRTFYYQHGLWEYLYEIYSRFISTLPWII